ncbi:hypothetical protein [Corynebacterium halotolerans]|nr:hypothetical protein [Corynebacterium halotolerans]
MPRPRSPTTPSGDFPQPLTAHRFLFAIKVVTYAQGISRALRS